MLLSGFTIVRNAIKFNYPVLESIRSILPLCDEFVIGVGDSEDGTPELLASLKSPKIRIIPTLWDMAMGKEVLSFQTNLILNACRGTWAFYLQSDEVIHEADWPRLKENIRRAQADPKIDALRFRWLHFYGSYYRYRIDSGWYQKQDRIIRNNGTIESYGDAYAFRRKDGQPLQRQETGCFVYHYGWVHSGQVMANRRVNAAEIGFVRLEEKERAATYDYGDLNRFPPYFGAHPAVMSDRVSAHALSRQDAQVIKARYWWHPLRLLKVRYKTGRRIKGKL